jgi:hypothetical protein
MEMTEIEICFDKYQKCISSWKDKEISDRDFFVSIIEISYDFFKMNEPAFASGVLCDITAEYLSEQFVTDCISDHVFSDKSDFVYKELIRHGYIRGGPVANMAPAMA